MFSYAFYQSRRTRYINSQNTSDIINDCLSCSTRRLGGYPDCTIGMKSLAFLDVSNVFTAARRGGRNNIHLLNIDFVCDFKIELQRRLIFEYVSENYKTCKCVRGKIVRFSSLDRGLRLFETISGLSTSMRVLCACSETIQQKIKNTRVA